MAEIKEERPTGYKRRGAPPKWSNPQEFSEAVDNYFECDETPTWTGLAIYLGFESRQSLWDYKQKEDFSYPIKKALLRIEEQYEKCLYSKNPTGAIFALKNFGWKDRQEIDQSGGITIRFEKPESYVYPTPDEGNNREPEGI